MAGSSALPTRRVQRSRNPLLPRKNIGEKTDKPYVRRADLVSTRAVFSENGHASEGGGCVQRHSFKAKRYFLVTSRRMLRCRAASQELFGQENMLCSSIRGYDFPSPFRQYFVFPNSNDRESLASENVIHLALRSRIPRSWNSRSH